MATAIAGDATRHTGHTGHTGHSGHSGHSGHTGEMGRAVRGSAQSSGVTRRLVACGALAGPLFVGAVLAQALTRPGFDLTQHPLSLLSLGDGGWVQAANFVVAGVLSVACAIGLRRALRGERGGTWGPLLIGAWGVGLLAGGAFGPDPALGFPPGAPAGNPEVVSWHGMLHTLAFNVGTLALTAACVVFARRFAWLNDTGWMAGSVGTAIAIPVLVVAGTAMGIQGAPGAGIVFFLIPVVAWLWLSLLALRLRAPAPRGGGR